MSKSSRTLWQPISAMPDFQKLISSISTASLKLYSRLLRMRERDEFLQSPTLKRVNFVYHRRMHQLEFCHIQLMKWKNDSANAQQQTLIEKLLKQISIVQKVNQETLQIVQQIKLRSRSTKYSESIQPRNSANSDVLTAMATIMNHTLKSIEQLITSEFQEDYHENKSSLLVLSLGIAYGIAEKGEKIHAGLANEMLLELEEELKQKNHSQRSLLATQHETSQLHSATLTNRTDALNYLRQCLADDIKSRFFSIPDAVRDNTLLFEAMEIIMAQFIVQASTTPQLLADSFSKNMHELVELTAASLAKDDDKGSSIH